MTEDKIRTNLRMAMYLISGSNFLGALAFLATYFYMKEILLLLASVLLLVAGVTFIFIVKRFQNKLDIMVGTTGENNERK